MPEPEQPAVPWDELRTIELIDLPPPVEEPAPPPVPPEALEPEAPPPPEAPPDPETPAEPDAPPPPREPATGDPTRPPSDAPPTGEPAPAEAPSDREEAGVSLLGLRSSSKAGTGTRLSFGHPKVTWSPPAGGGSGDPRPLPAPGPALPPDHPAGQRDPDRKPRSFAEAGFKERRGQLVYRDERFKFRAIVEPDGRLVFRELVGVPKALPGMAEAMRAGMGQELYQQEKRRLLEQTRELRMNLAVRWAQEQLERQLGALRAELGRVWYDPATPASQRRRTLFERWDECEEGLPLASDTPPEDDRAAVLADARQDAGKKARRTIVEFIRKNLPQGSADAYTAQELQQLNARRRSRQRFAPYEG